MIRVHHQSILIAHCPVKSHTRIHGCHLFHTTHELRTRHDHRITILSHRLKINHKHPFFLRQLGSKYGTQFLLFLVTQGNLFRLFLRDQLVNNIRIHPNKPMIGILLFQMVDKVCIQLSIHQQHIISLALGRLDIRVLLFHIRGIQEHHLIIFIRLVGFNQVLVLFIREIFSFRILE